ncbi:TPA: ABC transporter permease [Bacillus anthracis]|uniref:ABC transporter permease n=1 Tax=Bacillus anthracis TaxID=1392 RepID=UPI0001DBF589|nr:ABC transporter permease [Bacillus cereus]HDR4494468.1 ABC transporter permease [Bacillus cereus biovar anthracis]ADK04451.1 ABC transporter, permease protein, putative [Bacillus cereus biovar anthracis str. CI]HDR6226503.1 ABC transporter permease [Bacillus cereus biovar anthracis]HDR6232269.1 ABC transporter permease [Bacillus cereus biovar anthracis]HDR6237324.1 ABC transporter permease [Bacillus cereus biovar anthracis]
MKDILWLIQKTLSVLLKNKKSLLIIISLPIIGTLISFSIYGNVGQGTLNIGIVNKENEPIANDTINFLEGLNHVNVSKVKESEVEDKLTSKKLDGVITLDSGFSTSVREGKPNHIEIASIKGDQVTVFIKSYLYNYIDNIAAISKVAGTDQSTFNSMYAGYQKSSFKVKSETLEDTSKNKDMTNQTMGYLIMFMLFSAVNLSGFILKEKENRTYFRLLSTPIDGKKFILSNVAVNMMILILQIVIAVLFMTNVFHTNINMPFIVMIGVLMIFALIAVGLSLVIVSFSKSSAASNAMQNIVIVPTCLLAGCYFPYDIMPKAVQKVANFLPQRWLLDTIAKLQQGIPFSELYVNILILFAFAIAFFLIAIYKFGRNNDARNFV